MDIVYSTKKYLKPSVYNSPCVGYFAIDTGDSLLWDKCREEFLKRLPVYNVSNFYFCHANYSSDGIAHFLIKTEQILNLKTHSNFGKTDLDSIIWIEPSPFWMDCQMRRQLLTILIRNGINYTPAYDNYEHALWAPDSFEAKYTAETKNAVMRFLFGFTKYTGAQDNFNHQSDGWWSTFNGKKDSEIRELLISPENEFNFVGAGKLWG